MLLSKEELRCANMYKKKFVLLNKTHPTFALLRHPSQEGNKNYYDI